MDSILSRITISLIAALAVTLSFACRPAAESPDLTAAASSFEGKLNKLDRSVSQLAYPQEIAFESMIPSTWYIECTQLPHDPNLLGCYLGVPLRSPFPVYNVGVPCGLKPDRYMVFDEHTETFVLASGSCSDLKATHALYLIKSPPVFPGQPKTYHLRELTDDLIKANPYHSTSPSDNETITTFRGLLASLDEHLDFMHSDASAAIAWADFLEKTYFLPNSWCWDTRKEVLAYKDSMIRIRSAADKVKTSVEELAAWDFSALRK
ncbi:MAG: hypothetical protein PHO26_02345 [Dehalococcoidia bacterium]|nr:hypothetical protein [Dehalococcoidia bacterium]MDD5494979.1 hypothetical protein [Dehalococcoidia bacterium]